MAKQVPPKAAAPRRRPGSADKTQTRGKKPPKKRKSVGGKSLFHQLFDHKQHLPLVGLEISGLALFAVVIIMVLLGYSARWFSGIRFFASLLPFAFSILGLIVLAAIFLIGWWQLRKRLQQWWVPLPALLSLIFALVVTGLMISGRFDRGFESFRNLVGGRQQDRRITIAHQVFAAYRRCDQVQLQKMIDRAQKYVPAIREAAEMFDVDPDLLEGVAAVESSFVPRQSKDGGQGLFQITQVPHEVSERVRNYLQVPELLLTDPRQNACVAAAELKYYLEEMDGNLFLGLLAYNIGPANGGLRFIMRQYGATNFVTIQPYLKQLPRDYPIRVLSYSLAFRIWRRQGRLLAYEEGRNARIIQHIGIPGLNGDE